MTGFVLASSSPRRLALLGSIGLTPDRVVAPEVNEDPLPKEKPRVLAQRLALAKAQAGAVLAPGAVVLAADTVVSVGARILPKTEGDPAEARACLELLSGRAHQVTTAVAVLDANGKARQRAVLTRVSFKRLTPAEIDGYLATNEWVGKAGGYGVQGVAGRFVISLTGSYTGVVGLPLYETANLLASCGVRL